MVDVEILLCVLQFILCAFTKSFFISINRKKFWYTVILEHGI